METFISRINDLATNEGITLGQLERKIGASKGVLTHAMKNGSDIQSKWLQKIAYNYPAYSIRWLLTGSGSMLEKDQLLEPEIDYERDCPKCRLYEKTIEELTEKITLLKETVSVQKELIIKLKH